MTSQPGRVIVADDGGPAIPGPGAALADRAARAGPRRPTAKTCVALVDLDLSKQVNDRFGHAMGDQVLRRVVELLQTDLPPRSFCARYGGEEFVLVLPGAAPEQAVALCERARHRIEGEDWSRLTPGLRVTVSSRLHAATRSGCNAVAFSVATDSPVQLAGAAARRRVVRDVDHAAAEECRSP